MTVTDLVMAVDADTGLRPGARLIVNTLAVTEPQDTENNRDDDMEELTGKKYVLVLSLSV